MNNTEKQNIATRLAKQVEVKGSQNKLAKSLDVSSATVSQIINNNWELINDEMWRNIASQLGVSNEQWVQVQTRDFKLFSHLLNDAQKNSGVYAVVGTAGSGKTAVTKHFANSNKRVYLLQCNEYWNRKYFLASLLKAMGKDQSGLTVSEMMEVVEKSLKSQDRPLIILDEADKLKDQVLLFFITIYNLLEDRCGIVLCATDHLEKKINKGVKNNKSGYKEIFSRIGRKFIELKGVGFTDVNQICRANGIEDNKAIKEIYQDSELDLRRVKRKIHAMNMINNQTAA